MFRHHLCTLYILLILLCPILSFAFTDTATIPLETPQLTESTLIEGIGWSAIGQATETHACKTAHDHAVQHIRKGIVLARSKRLVTAEQLSKAYPATIIRSWDPALGKCTITLQLEVPGPPTRSVPVTQEQRN